MKNSKPFNFVAKYARRFNKAVVMASRKKQAKNGYAKHKLAIVQRIEQ